MDNQSLLHKLKSGMRNIRTIKFPGTDQDVGLRVLTNAETQEALFAAEERFKSKKIEVSSTTVEAYDDENTTQLLARALRDPDDPDKPFAKNADQLRKLVTREEKNILVGQYNDFEQEVSPSVLDMSDEELETLFEVVKKKPESGNNLSTPVLRELIVYLASRPQS